MEKPPTASDQSGNALNPTVVKLGIVSFFADVASEMLYPITPIFLTTVLGASASSLGLIEGVAEAIASLMKTYSGFWSDRISKRKPFVIAGYFLAAISKPLIGMAGSWSDVLVARGIDRTGKGIRTAPRDALLAEAVTSKNRGAAFGWHRGMDTLGAAVGPLLAIYLLNLEQQQLRQLYYWALIPGLLAVVMLFFVKERPHKASGQRAKNFFASWNDLSKGFKTYVFIWGLFSLVNSSDAFLLLKAQKDGLSLTTVILAYCAYNLVYALSSPYLGKLSDQIPRKRLLIFGLFIFALVYAGFAMATAAWQIWMLFLLYGLYMGATDGVGKALAVDLAPKDLKGTAIGVLGTVTGVSTVIASVVGGALWDHLSPAWTFFYGATGAVLSAVLLIWF